VNAHGLPRDIPDSIKREVRQRCGFGCIICGSAVVQYHHFAPEYADAKEHRAEGIILVCGRCHSKVKQLGTAGIEKANALPFCKRVGVAKDDFLFQSSVVDFQIGSATFKRHAIIVYDNEPLIGFREPEDANAPLRLSARLLDDNEEQLIEIVDNEWSVGVDFFDVETTGNSLTIRRKERDIVLRLILEEGKVILERMKMGYKGFRVSVEKNGLFVVRNPKGGTMKLVCPNIYSTLRLSSQGGAGL